MFVYVVSPWLVCNFCGLARLVRHFVAWPSVGDRYNYGTRITYVHVLALVLWIILRVLSIFYMFEPSLLLILQFESMMMLNL